MACGEVAELVALLTVVISIWCPASSIVLKLLCSTFSVLSGTGPNIARNAIVNCTELVTYDFIKDTLIKSTAMTGETKRTSQYNTNIVLSVIMQSKDQSFGNND